MTTLQERVHSLVPPVGWSLNKLHRILRVRKGNKNFGMQERNLLSLSYGRIVNKNIEGTEGLLPESFETYQIVEPGNIVMRLTDLQNDKRSLRQGLVQGRGIITSAYDALEVADNQDPRFWAYALLALDLAKYYYSLGAGVRQSIKFADFPNDWVATPAFAAQSSIADFLDRETGKIDQLIEKKVRLVDLLNEKRFAEISSLLTSGLHKSAPTKPSGLDWIESIPAHWNWMRLKDVCTRIIDCKNRTPPPVDAEDFFVVRTSCVRGGRFDIAGGYWTDEASFMEWTKRGLPQAGDVLFTREAPVGEACIAPTGMNFCLGQRMMIYRPNQAIIAPEYIVATVYSSIGESYVRSKSKGSTVGHLRVSEVYDFPCLLPPLIEQAAILRELERRVGRFSEVKVRVLESGNKLRELRSALITAAVTGQINTGTWTKRGITDRHLDHLEEALGA